MNLMVSVHTGSEVVKQIKAVLKRAAFLFTFYTANLLNYNTFKNK